MSDEPVPVPAPAPAPEPTPAEIHGDPPTFDDIRRIMREALPDAIRAFVGKVTLDEDAEIEKIISRIGRMDAQTIKEAIADAVRQAAEYTDEAVANVRDRIFVRISELRTADLAGTATPVAAPETRVNIGDTGEASAPPAGEAFPPSETPVSAAPGKVIEMVPAADEPPISAKRGNGMPKFAKGDRVSFVGDPADESEVEGTVMQFISGTFNKYEVHTDRGSQVYLKEEELEPAAPVKKAKKD